MKKKLKIAFKFIYVFGFFNGVILALKYITIGLEKVNIPNFKFPIFLRKGTSDFPTFKQVFLDNQYSIKFNKKTEIIIDGGANIGLFALMVKNELANAKVICVEPDEDNFKMLQKNLENYSNVFFENCGLWKKDTKLKVYDKFNCGKWGMVVEEDIINGTINALSINTLIEKYNIDFIDILKLDIETSEKILFSENYEKWLPKVKKIIIEFHDGFEDGCSKTFFEAINKTFKSYSFSNRGENVIITNNDILYNQSK